MFTFSPPPAFATVECHQASESKRVSTYSFLPRTSSASIRTTQHPSSLPPSLTEKAGAAFATMRCRPAALLTAALASLAAACGNHKHDDHEWTAEELAELEHKWGMEVS